jgi:CheY-specific phosphatase CheX
MVAEDARVSERSAFLFQHLVAMFETLALQQLGKLVNPITGNAEMDLRQARITIDMLEMVREKTVGNLSPEEKQLLEAVLTELQMNYVDESRREKNKEEGNL